MTALDLIVYPLRDPEIDFVDSEMRGDKVNSQVFKNSFFPKTR